MVVFFFPPAAQVGVLSLVMNLVLQIHLTAYILSMEWTRLGLRFCFGFLMRLCPAIQDLSVGDKNVLHYIVHLFAALDFSLDFYLVNDPH